MEVSALQEVVKNGGVILYPTDTIRGLGCDATNEHAVEKVFSIKKRPKEKSLIVLMNSEEMLREYGVVLSETQKTFIEQAVKPVTIVLS